MKYGVSPQKLRKCGRIHQFGSLLGLDLHSNSHEPVNFFGAQSSLGRHNFRLGAQAVIWGGTVPECPPVAPGLVRSIVRCISSHI